MKIIKSTDLEIEVAPFKADVPILLDRESGKCRYTNLPPGVALNQHLLAGDVFSTSRVAGIMVVKAPWQIIKLNT
ncbi:MAG: hypothetical protein RBS38_06385 [Bacteroidales bacterium]|jgi:hypothetical protein|nr:hypothetical protein [Bacteroidales bacterium]